MRSATDDSPDTLTAARRELVAAIAQFRPSGHVLELACGPGTWTSELLRYADTVTAIDGSSEMLALARRSVPEERVEGEHSSTVERRLTDGTAFRIVKVPHTPRGLEQRLSGLGWRIEVRTTSGPFFWGSGDRRT